MLIGLKYIVEFIIIITSLFLIIAAGIILGIVSLLTWNKTYFLYADKAFDDLTDEITF